MEVWKPIKDYEEFYEVSNYGRIRSKDRIKKVPFGRSGIQKGKVIKLQLNSRGYVRVVLSNQFGKKAFLVHRLVAAAFIENPDGLPVINHKDFNPLNNNADNLEWTTPLGNTRYSLDRGRFKRTPEWISKLKSSLDAKMGKPVIGTNINTGEIIFFNALNDCKKMGFQPSCVSNCCNGIRHHHLGFTWRFANEM
jgi:hypothetical protein